MKNYDDFLAEDAENGNNVIDILFEKLEKHVVSKTFKKKELFIDSANATSSFFLLKSGIARAFVVDKDGKEFTRALFTPVTPIAAIRAWVTNQSSVTQYDCLTECEMLVGDFSLFMELTKTDIELSNAYSRMLEYSFLQVEERVFELTLNAEFKYKALKKRIPEIENLIPQYQIASYLNITNVQLSRMRKKLLYK